MDNNYEMDQQVGDSLDIVSYHKLHTKMPTAVQFNFAVKVKTRTV